MFRVKPIETFNYHRFCDLAPKRFLPALAEFGLDSEADLEKAMEIVNGLAYGDLSVGGCGESTIRALRQAVVGASGHRQPTFAEYTHRLLTSPTFSFSATVISTLLFSAVSIWVTVAVGTPPSDLIAIEDTVVGILRESKEDVKARLRAKLFDSLEYYLLRVEVNHFNASSSANNGDFGQAQQDIIQALDSIHRKESVLQFSKGVYERDGKLTPENGLSSFQTAFALDSTNAGALAEIARAKTRLGQFREAMELLRKLAVLTPDDGAAELQLGNILFSMGR